MPPKVSKLKKAKQKLKEKKEEKIKPMKKKEYIKTVIDIDKLKEEDIVVRDFFNGIKNDSSDDIVEHITLFMKEKSAPWTRKKFFKNFLVILPQEYYSNFLTEYISQDSTGLDTFFENYIERPDVKASIMLKASEDDDAFLKDLDEKDKAKAEKDKLKKLLKGMHSDSGNSSSDSDNDMDEQIYEKIPRTPRPIIMIDNDGKPIFPSKNIKPTTYGKYENTVCIQNYKTFDWIDKKVKDVYIAPVNDNNISKYFIKEDNIEYNGITWYKANKLYFSLVCNVNERFKQQEGNITLLWDEDKKAVKMMVGFLLIDGNFIMQDEALFLQEKQYFKMLRSTRAEKTVEAKKGPITKDIIRIVADNLSYNLHKLAPLVKDYGISDNDYVISNTSYIITLAEVIAEHSINIGDYLDKAAKLITYINFTDIGETLFQKRLKKEYYLPEILATLPVEMVFPEYYDNPKITKEQIDALMSKINFDTNESLKQLDQILYNLLYPGERTFPVKSSEYFGNNPVKVNWKSNCINKEDVKDINDEEVFYYKTKDGVYCLLLEDILNTRINKYTGEALDEKFIENISKYYPIDHIKSVTTKKDETTSEKQPEIILTPGLIDMVQYNITKCLQQIDIEPGKVCPIFNDESGDGKSDDDKSDDGKSDDDKSDDDKSDDDKSDDKSDGLSPSVCLTCKNSNTNLKTMIYNNNSFKKAEFCDAKCFEKYNKEFKNIPTGIKNGRKKTTD